MLRDHRTLVILGGLAALGTISCTGYIVEPIEWTLEGTAFWSAPLYRDPAGSRPKARGTMRVRSQHWVGTQYGKVVAREDRRNLALRVRGLGSVQNYALSSPLWTSPVILTTNLGGVLDTRHGISIDVPSPGGRVAIGETSGSPIIAGAVPDWRDPPGGTGRLEDDFGSGTGTETVHVRTSGSSRTGMERLEFRMAGLFPWSSADLFLEDGGSGFVRAESVSVDSHGKAVLLWISRGSDPLPLGAFTVGAFHGKAFQVRVGAETVVEGVVP
jgi:hypothetical protein